jgi:cytochrome P450
MPWIDWIFEKNPIVSLFKQKSSSFFIFASRLVQERAEELKILKKQGKSSGARLLIDRFLEAQQKHPDVIDNRTVGIYTTSNIVAGSDTIAIVLRTIMYMVLRNPDVLKKLLEELDGAQLSFPVTWEESQKLPYTSAVIHEALRIHPPVGFGLERVVPAGGFLLDDGTNIPQGVQVSMNAWVLHQNPIFEADTMSFKPERWLNGENETESGYQERIAAMKRAWLPFGHGSRACMGKHISYLEMYKLVPTMFSELEFELCEGLNKEWKTRNSWFVRQWDMDCYIKKR